MIKISLSAMERNLPNLYKTYDDVDFNTGDVSGTAIHRLRSTINPYTGRAYTDDDILHLHHAVLSHELREAKGGLSSKYSPKNQIGSHIHPSVIQNDVRLAYRLPDIQRRNLLHQSLKDIVSTPEYALNSNARNAIEEMKDEIHDPYTPKWKKMFSSYKNNSSGDKTMWDYYRNNKNLFATNTPFDENASKYLQLGIRDATRRRMINAIDDFGRAIANKIIK